MRGLVLAIVGGAALVGGRAEAAPRWQLGGTVAPGTQFAAVGDGAVVHVVAGRYVQVDGAGAVVVQEDDVADERQGPLDFYPAIAVGDDGAVHVVTRHGGDFATGHEIRYRRRGPDGGWEPAIVVGSPVARNYVVGVAAPSGGRVVVSHGRLLADVNAVIDVYEIAAGAASPIGTTPQGWLRADNDYRLATSANAVVLASGTPGPGDPVHFGVAADADADLVAQWQASQIDLDGGLPRRGGADVFVDASGGVHVGYGGESTHHYAQFASDGAVVTPSTQTVDGLGTWHLSYGNGAVAASADGSRVMVVALQNLDGDAVAADSEILWAESEDGGVSFGPAQSLGVTTNGGEGRMRPRLTVVGDSLVLLYADAVAGGIAVATADWAVDEPGTTGGDDDGSDEGADDAVDGGSDGGADESGTEVGDDASDAPDPDEADGDEGATATQGTDTDALPPSSQRGTPGGCGCTASGTRWPGWGVLVVLVAGFRRRRLSRRAASAAEANPDRRAARTEPTARTPRSQRRRG